MGLWYKDFYIATKKGEADMRKALADPVDGGANRTDIENRLNEMRQLDPGRCAISAEQVLFLERVLAS